jgi:hypothetical protein
LIDNTYLTYLLRTFYPYAVKEHGLSYVDKKYVVDMLDKYCLSRYLDLDDFIRDMAIPEYSGDLILKYLEKMADRSIQITFNYMLKELHHQLADGSLRIDIDMLFVDEAQDLTPVMLEIFGLIQATVKLYLGDTSQDIYSFLDLVSAFTLSVDPYELTTSFRLSPSIAARIEPFCKDFIDPDFKLTGVSNDTSDRSEGYITYTNAEIIEEVANMQVERLGYCLTRPAKEIFEVAIAVEAILQGEPNKKPKYWGLVKLVDQSLSLKRLLASEKLDDDILSSIKLIQTLRHKHIDIMDVLNKAEKDKADPDYLIGTAHSVKGLEMGSVTISEGLNKYVRNLLDSVPMTQEETDEIVEGCKLYYVACSRAKHTLRNAGVLNTRKGFIC